MNGRLRHHAVEIVGQLPENPSEARTVLNLALELVDTFLDRQTPPEGRRPCLRAISSDKSPVSPDNTQPTDNPGICRAND